MGGTAIMNRVGHSFIKQTMRDRDGVFGGEVTGHYYFRENFYADNGFIPALMLLELMSVKGQSLAELLAPLKAKYFISGEINTKVASMDVVQGKLDGLSKRYADGTVTHLDGVSVEYPDWHFNVRASNTEPLLRLNLEATTPAQMEEKRDEVLGFIEAEQLRIADCRIGVWRDGNPQSAIEIRNDIIRSRSGLSIVVMLWLPKPARRVRFP